MKAKKFIDQLRQIASADDFESRSEELTEAWSSAGVGIEAVEPILRFMEDHPSLDFGTPGALVHFVEGFYGKGYEDKLVESVTRKPTPHTVWMLNRVINGTTVPELRQRFVTTMEAARVNPLADQNTLHSVNRFLKRLSH